MDRGKMSDNVYMVNGRFRESFSVKSKSFDLKYLDKIRVVFKEE
jgi:hypothetical protein